MDPSDNAWKRELRGAHHRGVRDNGIGVLWPGTDRCRTDTGNVAGGKTQLGGIRGNHSLTEDWAGKRTFTNAEAGGGYRVHTNSRHTQQERLSEIKRPHRYVARGLPAKHCIWVKKVQDRASRASDDTDMSIRKCSEEHRLLHTRKRSSRKTAIAIDEPRPETLARSNSKYCLVLTEEHRQNGCIKPGPTCIQ